MNKFLFSLLLLTPAVYATVDSKVDWLDAVVDYTAKHGFDKKRSVSIIQHYIDKDKADLKECDKLEKAEKNFVKAKDDKSVTDKAREAACSVDRSRLEARLKTHEGAIKTIEELAVNEKDRKSFVKNCKLIHQANQELVALEAKYAKSTETLESAKLKTKILAKQAYIAGKRAIVRNFAV